MPNGGFCSYIHVWVYKKNPDLTCIPKIILWTEESFERKFCAPSGIWTHTPGSKINVFRQAPIYWRLKFFSVARWKNVVTKKCQGHLTVLPFSSYLEWQTFYHVVTHLRWLEIVFIFSRLVLQIVFQIQFGLLYQTVKFTTDIYEMS